MKVSIGNDHAGTKHKLKITEYLERKKFKIKNHGTNKEESVDYPDFIHPVAEDVASGQSDFGIIICGSGNGASMSANKHKGIRSALCWNNEICKLAREHNDANILSLPARYVTIKEAFEMIETFIQTPFEGGRHQIRVEKINK
ncbi:ribose 5-phosphate isomerase B [Flavobacteriaceae bacterium]|jgi:ribose 5-phosphate isomerase B|nr:ribose 5-phosphate isomerase B [bacterium]MDB4180002.1 ribose 5-phosphate isomerase B [Flavobacteriaceae bacterium]MDC1310023.1 ribose 5-phosphate isomerase B [Flavobacteriaceae bacterium]